MLIDSAAAICTLSMDLLKSVIINDIADPVSKYEQLCARWYDLERKALIESMDFQATRSRAVLSLNLGDQLVYGDSIGTYNLPLDYAGLIWIGTEDYPLSETEYRIERNKLVLPGVTDDSVTIGYKVDETNVNLFSANFKRLLAARLALSVAHQVTGKIEYLNPLAAIVEKWELAAQNAESLSNPCKVITMSRLAGARRARAGEIGAISYGKARLR